MRCIKLFRLLCHLPRGNGLPVNCLTSKSNAGQKTPYPLPLHPRTWNSTSRTDWDIGHSSQSCGGRIWNPEISFADDTLDCDPKPCSGDSNTSFSDFDRVANPQPSHVFEPASFWSLCVYRGAQG